MESNMAFDYFQNIQKIDSNTWETFYKDRKVIITNHPYPKGNFLMHIKIDKNCSINAYFNEPSEIINQLWRLGWEPKYSYS